MPRPQATLKRRPTDQPATERSAGQTPADSRRQSLAAVTAENDRQLEDLIARRLALPLEKRMNFLRRRLPGGGSCL